MWDLLTARNDLRRTEVRPGPVPGPDDGQAVLEIERFALTSNNVTYARLGDLLGYWQFFPAPDGWGRIPAWGFARVVDSRAPGIDEGLRIYGYLPMSSHVAMQLAPGRRADEVVDGAAHRAELSPVYNTYFARPEEPTDDHRAALQPLFSTSFLLDDDLAQEPLSAAVLSSASSKTAMGLAWLLRRRGVTVIGLTSADKVASLEDHGLYDRLDPYEGFDGNGLDGPAAFVDFAGNPAVVAEVHRRLADRLTRSMIVGATHWDASGDQAELPGPTPAFFFAPSQARTLAARIGPAELSHRMDTTMEEFVAASPWLRVVEHVGPDALRDAYDTVVAGRAAPEDIHIIRPGG